MMLHTHTFAEFMLSVSRNDESEVERSIWDALSAPWGAYIGWRYLTRNRGAPCFVMTSLSCRRVDNAPCHCRFLRTFDFTGDCRVNFSGVCCIVAREYEGRRFAATREGCFGYSSSLSFSLILSLSLSFSLSLSPHWGP